MRAWLLTSFNPDTSEATTAVGVLAVGGDDVSLSTIPHRPIDGWLEVFHDAVDSPVALTDGTVDEWLEQVTNGVTLAAAPIDADLVDADLTAFETASDLVERWATSGV